MEFSCVATLEKYIESIDPNQIKPGIIGRWKNSTSPNDDIKITGKFVCKSSYFGKFFAVRWISKDGKGLFGKGLAFYNNWNNRHQFPLLPITK